MKDRILDLLKSPIAMLVGIVLLVPVLFWIVREQRMATPPPTKQPAPRLPLVDDGGKSLKESPVTELAKHFTPWQSVARPKAAPEKKPEPTIEVKPGEPLPKLIHDFEVVQKPVPKEVPAKPVVRSIPFGSAIPCRLLQAVQCGNDTVPVIAELLQPVRDAKGQNWIPRGTRLHGSVHSGSLPGRIESAAEWVFALPGQKLLETKASLQDRDFDSVRRIYGVNDGTAGISGTVVQVKKNEWKQTVLKEGIAVAADAAQDRMTTALGVVEMGSARNAVLGGVSSLVKRATPTEREPVTESIVSVPAGKEFYLYIEDRGDSQPAPGAGEVETMLRERARLMEQLRQQTGKERP